MDDGGQLPHALTRGQTFHQLMLAWPMRLVALVVLAVVVLFVGHPERHVHPGPPRDFARDVQVGNVQVERQVISSSVTGTVTNVSDRPCRFVNLRFELLDERGEKLGEQSVIVDELEPGQEKAFDMLVLKDQPIEARFVGVTGL